MIRPALAFLLLSAVLPVVLAIGERQLFGNEGGADNLRGSGQRRLAWAVPRRLLLNKLGKFNTGATSPKSQQQQQQSAAGQLSEAQPGPLVSEQPPEAQQVLATLPGTTQQATPAPVANPSQQGQQPATAAPQTEQRMTLIMDPAKQPPPPPPVASSPPPPPPLESPPPPSVQTPPPPPPTLSGEGGCPDVQATLDSINSVRARWSAAPLSWSVDLARSAKAVADTCVFEHSGGPYGENLMKGGGLSLAYTSTPCSQSAGYSGWASEYVNWPGGNDFVYDAGHFTQLVWRSTQQVGCAYSDCSGDSYVVCHFFPRGNIGGEFAANVGPAQ